MSLWLLAVREDVANSLCRLNLYHEEQARGRMCVWKETIKRVLWFVAIEFHPLEWSTLVTVHVLLYDAKIFKSNAKIS